MIYCIYKCFLSLFNINLHFKTQNLDTKKTQKLFSKLTRFGSHNPKTIENLQIYKIINTQKHVKVNLLQW